MNKYLDCIEYREAQMNLTALVGCYSTHHIGTIVNGLRGMKGTLYVSTVSKCMNESMND